MLKTIELLDEPTMTDIVSRCGIPVPTVKRYLPQIRADFNVDVKFFRVKGVRGTGGFYRVVSWGVLNKDQILGLDFPE